MLKEALQYIIGLSQPPVFEVEGKQFCLESGKPVPVVYNRLPGTLKFSTLTSLCEYIKEDVDNIFGGTDDGKWIIHVVSPTQVILISPLNEDENRQQIIEVKPNIPHIGFGRFICQEEFVIMMQSQFLANEDKQIVLQVAGNVEDKTVANYGDDGITQKATIKTGIAAKDDVVVPNPVRLVPFRTFHEIEQPESSFIFRMRNSRECVECAIFEADGGEWESRAVHGIADYLKKELEGNEQIIVLS